MAGEKTFRLSQVARKLNVGTATIAETLASKGFEIENKPNSKITVEQFDMLSKEFESSAMDKEEALGLMIGQKHADNMVIDSDSEIESRKRFEEEEFFIKDNSLDQDTMEVENEEEAPAQETKEIASDEPKESDKVTTDTPKLRGVKVLGKIDLDQARPQGPAAEEAEKPGDEGSDQKVEEASIEEAVSSEDSQTETPQTETPQAETSQAQPDTDEAPAHQKSEVIQAKVDALRGLTVVGKIDLPAEKKREKPVASSDDRKEQQRKKRPRKRMPVSQRSRDTRGRVAGAKSDKRPGKFVKEEPSDKEIQDQIKATLAKLSGGKKRGVSRAKYKKDKRSAVANATEEKLQHEQEEAKILKITEFISANDLASLMDVSVNDVISTFMELGLFVSINQRLDAETITVIADEFGFGVEFTSTEEEVSMDDLVDPEEDVTERAPIVTIMGHVDHGKTSLLDFIRHSKVTEGEAGGITQHIGAYDVTTKGEKRIAFLDTPGHEAFTAMRARGAKVTDVVIIVVAADDGVMPQTKEAINHAQVARVPIVVAINKIDRPNANSDKIKEELSGMNILVEDWGGKYQSQEVSAKTGEGVEELLEKVLLEAELLELKANPNKPAIGTVIEASLDKGRGYITTVLVQAGTLKVGDVIMSGSHFGRVKAMFDHRGQKLSEAGPSTPVQVLGLDGAPQAGEKLSVMASEREARELATRREQIQREQNIRTKKHITLDEIGRRLAIGSFKELNVIVKGDVDGSVEALSDSLLKLSTEEIMVSIIQKGVGQISESDVLFASASDAVIVGFQVRPSPGAKKLAEQEEIEIRLYSVIYDAINEVKDAMEGMLAPTEQEVITGNVEVREVFKISKFGTVAGCMVTDGFIKRANQIRLIRDGIVVYSGDLNQLKRFKNDVQDVKAGYECGISIKNFNDMKVGDVIEAYEIQEIKRTL